MTNKPTKPRKKYTRLQTLNPVMTWEETLVRLMLREAKRRKRTKFYKHELREFLERWKSETVSHNEITQLLNKMTRGNYLNMIPPNPSERMQRKQNRWEVSKMARAHIAKHDATRQEAGSLNPKDVFSKRLVQDAVVNAVAWQHIEFALDLSRRAAGYKRQDMENCPVPYMEWGKASLDVNVQVPDKRGKTTDFILSLTLGPRQAKLVHTDENTGEQVVLWEAMYSELRELKQEESET